MANELSVTGQKKVGTLMKEFNKKKINPNIVCINDDARTTMSWVNSKSVVTIVPNSASLFMGEGCKMLDVEDLDISSNIVLIYKKTSNLNKVCFKFIDDILSKIDKY